MDNLNQSRPAFSFPVNKATPSRPIPQRPVTPGAYSDRQRRFDVRADKRRGYWPIEVATSLLWLESACIPALDVACLAADEEVIMDLWP